MLDTIDLKLSSAHTELLYLRLISVFFYITNPSYKMEHERGLHEFKNYYVDFHPLSYSLLVKYDIFYSALANTLVLDGYPHRHSDRASL